VQTGRCRDWPCCWTSGFPTVIVAEKRRNKKNRIRASEDTIRKSLVGNWRQEHLFTLKQSLQLYRTYQEQTVECDQEIEKLLGHFEPRVDPNKKPLPPGRKRNRSDQKRRKKAGHSETGFDLRTEAYRLYGVDVTQIPGVETIALPLFAKWDGICLEIPDGSTFCFLVGTVPRQRH